MGATPSSRGNLDNLQWYKVLHFNLDNGVGYSYIMANATQGMAQHAKYRTRSNDEFGVLHVMDQVLQAQEG